MTVALFRRGRSKSDAAAPDGEIDPMGEADGSSVPDAAHGPFDRSEVADDSEYLNLGPLWLRGQQGLELRLEINEQEQQITGVTAVIGESAVQLQAFAAPRTEGVWIAIRDEIATSITEAGGTAEVVSGPFGEELLTRMPQAGADGRTVFMPARFLGIDGPRWFLRAVVSGRAAIEPEAATDVHELVRTAVIDRGDEAMPPREVLPLRLPEGENAEGGAPTGEGDDHVSDATGYDPASAGSTDEGPTPSLEDLKPFERGPEITEVR